MRNAMQANRTCWCKWGCSHCMQATSKEKRSNLCVCRIPRPVWIGPYDLREAFRPHVYLPLHQQTWTCRRTWGNPSPTMEILTHPLTNHPFLCWSSTLLTDTPPTHTTMKSPLSTSVLHERTPVQSNSKLNTCTQCNPYDRAWSNSLFYM